MSRHSWQHLSVEKHITVFLLHIFLVSKYQLVVPSRFSLPWFSQSFLWKHVNDPEKQYSARRLIFTDLVKRTNPFSLFSNIISDVFIRQWVWPLEVTENGYSLSTLFAIDECIDLNQFLPQLSFFQDGKLWDCLLNHFLCGSCARLLITPVALLWISSIFFIYISLEIGNHN